MLCLAPLVLIGAVLTVQPNRWHVSDFDGALVEAQTCEQGAGIDAKYGAAGIGSVMAQYGLGWTWGACSLTLSPKAGVGVIDRHVPELTSTVNFSLGAQVLVGYGRARVGVEWWHQSNAGLGDRNAGLDLVSIVGGVAF